VGAAGLVSCALDLVSSDLASCDLVSSDLVSCALDLVSSDLVSSGLVNPDFRIFRSFGIYRKAHAFTK
tara:strand:- start:14 stop:217 length:204 start_codon:yes stop_codon:yes gene_type:complete